MAADFRWNWPLVGLARRDRSGLILGPTEHKSLPRMPA